MVNGGYQYSSFSNRIRVYDVANYFLALSRDEEGSIVTYLGLQKLCFYANAWSLVWEHKPLFDEEFESGEYVPICPELVKKYRPYEHTNMIEPDRGFNPDIFSDKQKDMLDAVWNSYGLHGINSEIGDDKK